ncbi:hypothetical protein AFLA_001340 [Aspergillus flavus NRRL3357]|nr:hypothetical protein AFLA_001340 [Aspergillus flavus NRRL3357]
MLIGRCYGGSYRPLTQMRYYKLRCSQSDDEPIGRTTMVVIFCHSLSLFCLSSPRAVTLGYKLHFPSLQLRTGTHYGVSSRERFPFPLSLDCYSDL